MQELISFCSVTAMFASAGLLILPSKLCSTEIIDDGVPVQQPVDRYEKVMPVLRMHF